jgi:hypothetical protein
MLDIMEGKVAYQAYTHCGMRIDGMNNSQTWLAANPGATMEDFEKALPPAPTGCDLDDESPEPAEQTPLSQPTDDADASAAIVQESNRFHREVASWIGGFAPRFHAWSALTKLPDEAKDSLHNVLMLAANELMTLAQELDGRAGAAQIGEAA